MKHYFLPLMAALLFAGQDLMAQGKLDEKQKNAREDLPQRENSKSMKEYDEIIIKRKNESSDEKLLVEIKDDEVFVNGKPIDEFMDDSISVLLRSPNHFKFNMPSPFHGRPGAWMNVDEENNFTPFLGVMTNGVSNGCQVISVTGAAEKAGLKKDDIITSFNDKPVADHEQLTAVIEALKPDDNIRIAYKRKGKEMKTTATLGKRSAMVTSPGNGEEDNEFFGLPEPPVPPMPPEVFGFGPGGRRFEGYPERPILGLSAQDTEDGKGVNVLSVVESAPADLSGIKKGDVITNFDGKTINSADELARAFRESKDKSPVKVQLKRNGKVQNIELKIPKKLKTATL